MQEQENLCAVCQKIGTKSCGACGVVHYCSRDHQMMHWKTHSRNCKAYKLVENDEIGKHYVATRNIKVGKTVMHDKVPILTEPQNLAGRGHTTSNTVVGLSISPLCLNCYVELTGENAKICKCGWHLCRSCKNHGTECEFTQKYARSRVYISRTDYGKPHKAYEIIGVIRALALRKNDPKSYKKLMNLRDPIQSTLARKLLPEDAICRAAQFAKTFLKIDNIEEAEVCKIMRIIMYNGFIVPSTTVQYHAVYDVTSYIENSCRANCSKSFTDDGGVIIWAAVPISKGEHITVSYVPCLWGTVVRKRNLANSKFLDCMCERCKDPTEFGTMFSAFKCRAEQCDGPMLLPVYSVTEENYPDYVCSKCSATVSWESFQPIVEEIKTHWKFMEKTNPIECERFLEKWKNVLHENHFHIVDVKMDVLFIIGFRSGDLDERSDKCLTDLVTVCKKLIKLLRTLSPAEHTTIGLVLSVQARANKVVNTRAQRQQTLNEHMSYLVEHKMMLNEIHQLLNREPTWCQMEQEAATTVLYEITRMEVACRDYC